MPPQFKYALIGLFILTTGVLFYVISFTSTPPVNQTAVPPPAASPPPAQPPVQHTVYQPPVQPPPAPPQPDPQERIKADCDRLARAAHQQFTELNSGWREKFRNVATTDNMQVLRDYLDDVRNWRAQKESCRQRTGNSWKIPDNLNLTSFPEEWALREDCESRAKMNVDFLNEMRAMGSSEREWDRYVQRRWGTNGFHTFRDCVNSYDRMKRNVCASNLTGGWSSPPVESRIEQMRTVNR